MGAGTTGIAAKMENRNFVGIERELEYFNSASERINNAGVSVSEVDTSPHNPLIDALSLSQ
jgi:DNA modification methylase